MNHFFISKDTIKRVIFFSIVFIFFFPKTLLVSLIFFSFLLVLFRAPSFIKMDRGQLDQNMVFSPVNGVLIDTLTKNNKKIIVIKVGVLDGYSVTMPFGGEVTSYDEYEKKGAQKVKLALRAKSTQNTIKLKYKGYTKFRTPKLWCRAGDRANIGATLGYLPFGGKLVIELPENAKVLLDKNQRVHACNSIIASIEE